MFTSSSTRFKLLRHLNIQKHLKHHYIWCLRFNTTSKNSSNRCGAIIALLGCNCLSFLETLSSWSSSHFFNFETNTAHKPSDNMSLANNSSVGGFGDGGNIKVVDLGNFLFYFFSTFFHFSSCRKGSARQTGLLRKFLPGPMWGSFLVLLSEK